MPDGSLPSGGGDDDGDAERDNIVSSPSTVQAMPRPGVAVKPDTLPTVSTPSCYGDRGRNNKNTVHCKEENPFKYSSGRRKFYSVSACCKFCDRKFHTKLDDAKRTTLTFPSALIA